MSPFYLWGSTLLLALLIGLWKWLFYKPVNSPSFRVSSRIGLQVLPQLFRRSHINTVFIIIASTVLVQNALGTFSHLPFSVPIIHALPDLTPLYLAIHFSVVIWLMLGKLLPRMFHFSVAWIIIYLYSSYLYFRTFFSGEEGDSYSILYALTLGLLVYNFQPLNHHSQKTSGVLSPVFRSLFSFLVLTSLATALSSSPGESVKQFLQIFCFAFLSLWLSQKISSKYTWFTVAIWTILLGGGVWVVLAGVKFGLLVQTLGLIPALNYRLFVADVGPNWISYSLITVIPLSIALWLNDSRRSRQIVWLLGILGMFLAVAYTQSKTGYSGWLALILGISSLVLFLQYSVIAAWWQSNPRYHLPVIVAVITLCGIIFLVVGGLASQVNSYSLYTRLYGWWTLFYQVADYPFFGVGPGIRHITAQYGDKVLWEDIGASANWLTQLPLNQHLQQLQLRFHAHNLFLELAVGAGLPALMAFLWFLWELLKHGLITLERITSQNRLLVAGCIAGIVASLSWGLIDVMEFSPPFFTTPVWVLISLLLAAPRAFGLDDRERINGAAEGVRFFSPMPLASDLSPSGLRFMFYVLLFLFTLMGVIAPLGGNWHYRIAYTAYQEHLWATAAEELAQAAQWEPLNPKYQQLRGEVLINLGQYSEAIAAYQRALKFKRDFAPYHSQLGWLYWLQGDLDLAIRHFQKAVALDPMEAWRDGLHADLGLAYLADRNKGTEQQARVNQAIQLLKETIKLKPSMVSAPYWLKVQQGDGKIDVILDPIYISGQDRAAEEKTALSARISAHLGKTDYTQRLFTLKADTSPISLNQILDAVEADYMAACAEDSQEGPRLLATVAEAARLAGLNDRAEQAYLAFQTAYPNSAYGFRELGNFYREQGDPDQAQQMLERAVEVSPDDPSSWRGLTQLYLDQKRWKEAEQALDELYRLAPLDAKFYGLRAQLNQKQGNMAQAAESIHQLLFIRESVPERLILANLYRQQGQLQQAIDQCIQAADVLLRVWPRPLDPELWEVSVCLAKSSKSEDLLARITDLAYPQPFINNILMGHFYRAEGQLEQALTAYQQAAALRPDEGSPHYFLGETYQALGQATLAETEYQAASRLDSLESLPLLALGRMQWGQGRHEIAIKSFRTAVAATPGWGEVHIALGNALLATGDRVGAAEHYQVAQMADGAVFQGVLYDFGANLANANVQAPSPEYIRNDYFIINGDRRRVLFQHPDSQVTYQLNLPDRMQNHPAGQELKLSFAISTMPESWTQPGDGVMFAVYLEAGPERRQFFSSYIDPKHKQVDQRWHPTMIDLTPYAGQEISLIFKTSSGPEGDDRFDWAGWSEPQLSFISSLPSFY